MAWRFGGSASARRGGIALAAAASSAALAARKWRVINGAALIALGIGMAAARLSISIA